MADLVTRVAEALQASVTPEQLQRFKQRCGDRRGGGLRVDRILVVEEPQHASRVAEYDDAGLHQLLPRRIVRRPFRLRIPP
jgi:hypothetical protein